MATYNKPHLTLAQQVDLLLRRGLEIADRSEAERWLSVVGYYRLSGYWYPYRTISSDSPVRGDDFIPGTTFAQVSALYEFDRKLKRLTLDALERIEVAMRFRVGYTLGRRGAYAHENPANFVCNFTARSNGRSSKYEIWCNKLAQAASRSSEDFVKHFNTKYDGRLPVWVATELLDFGGLSFLYEGLVTADSGEIPADLAVTNERGGNGVALANWMRVLNYVRNICAHHSRLWNRNLTDQIATKHPRTIAPLRHLAEPVAAQANARPFAAICVMTYLLDQVAPGNEYARAVDALLADDLPATNRSRSEMGIPNDWTTFE